MDQKQKQKQPKKAYERPAIIYEEKIEARAVSCNKIGDPPCSGTAAS